jgi:hypothetical protein
MLYFFNRKTLLVSIQKRGFLFEIKACEKNYRRHIDDIGVYATSEDNFLSITQRSGKKTVSGRALAQVYGPCRMIADIER